MFHKHDRAFRILYQDHNSKFDKLLQKGSSFKIHDRNLHEDKMNLK